MARTKAAKVRADRDRVAKSFWKLGQKDWAAPATLVLKVGPFSQMAWTRSRADGCTSCTVADRLAATSTRLASMTYIRAYVMLAWTNASDKRYSGWPTSDKRVSNLQ